MTSKRLNSTNQLRRLSWPTLINSNNLIYKSSTMSDFPATEADQMLNKNLKKIRLIKLNNRNSKFKANSNLVDNLFRSIRKRKLKHPINCFNRKNAKLQLLLSYPVKDYLYLFNLKRSLMNNNNLNYLTQSATSLNELEDLMNLKTSSNQLRRTRSSFGESEQLKMEWLKAIRGSMETNSNLRSKNSKNLTKNSLNKSFNNNSVKLDCKEKFFFESAGDRLIDYIDSSNLLNNKAPITNNNLQQELNKAMNLKSPEFKKDKDNFLIDNHTIEELFSRDGLRENEQINQIDAIGQTNFENFIEEAFSFPVGRWEKTECEICFKECYLHRRCCCDFAACQKCLSQYFQERVQLGSFSIECINNNCHSPVNRNEISISLEPKYKEIYHNLLKIHNDIGKLKRTCPNCNFVYTLKDNSELKRMRKNRKKDPSITRVKCEECETDWCFLCHAPMTLHRNITCKQFIAGDQLLRDWAKSINGGQVNAQRCPKCKAFIQRISGCDHMHCSNCETDFCYKCGEKLRRLKFFGNHYSKLSVFGCKYRYKANQPALRKTIRFTVFCAKLGAAPILGSAVIAAIGCAFLAGITALPVYLGLRGARWVVEKRSHKFKQKNQSEGNSLKPISKGDIDSILNNSTKFDQQYINHFGINDSPFSQNSNWLANYGLSDLNTTTASTTSATNFSNFSQFNMNGLNINSIEDERNPSNYQNKRRKHRKPQLNSFFNQPINYFH